MIRRHSKKVLFLTFLLLFAGLWSGSALAASGNQPNKQGSSLTSPQPLSNADQNPGGANGQCPGGPYCSTRDGSPSLNGNGGGNATGKPCAGCVGKADNKNPQGQMPNGSDANNGYECDGNNGIGKSNPAHTPCKGSSTPPPVSPPPPPVVPPVTPPVVPPAPPTVPPASPPAATPPSTPASPAPPTAPQPPVTPAPPSKGGIGTPVCVMKNKAGKFVPCKHKPAKKAHKPKKHRKIKRKHVTIHPKNTL